MQERLSFTCTLCVRHSWDLLFPRLHLQVPSFIIPATPREAINLQALKPEGESSTECGNHNQAHSLNLTGSLSQRHPVIEPPQYFGT
jgi:hypothetical protein